MAITATLLSSGVDNVDRSTYTIGQNNISTAFSPTANRLVIALIHVRDGDGVVPTTPTLTGQGLTWTRIVTVESSDDVSEDALIAYRAQGASPSSGTLSLSLGDTMNFCVWVIAEFAGTVNGSDDGASAIRNHASNASFGTAISANLPAFGSATNATLLLTANEFSEPFTDEAGYTELAQVSGAGTGMHFLASADTTPSGTLADDAPWMAISLELVEATAATFSAALVTATAASPNSTFDNTTYLSAATATATVSVLSAVFQDSISATFLAEAATATAGSPNSDFIAGGIFAAAVATAEIAVLSARFDIPQEHHGTGVVLGGGGTSRSQAAYRGSFSPGRRV